MKRALQLAALSALVGCTQNDGSLAGAAPSARPAPAAQNRAQEPSIYDAEGRLLGSGIRLDWLEIPRGFSLRPSSTDGDVVYESLGISAARVREFLQPQMLTGSAEEIGEGVVYHGVMPIDGSPKALRYNVSVLEVAPKGSLFLRIARASFPEAPILPEAESRKLLAADRAHAE